jgi:hypothetical protein
MPDSNKNIEESPEIRWDLSDVVYLERKAKAVKKCKKFGLDFAERRFYYSSNTFPEIVNYCTKTITKLLRRRVEYDLAAVKIGTPDAADKYIEMIAERLDDEFLEFFVDFRESIEATLLSTQDPQYSIPLALHQAANREAQKQLEPFEAEIERLQSKIPGMQPGSKAYTRMRELIESKEYSVTIGEIIMGDVFKNIKNSTIVNRSIVEKSFNKIREEIDQDTAMALLRVAEEIDKSGNKEAADLFTNFNEELQKPEPKKPVLQVLWDGIVAALPDIAKMAEIGVSISKLLAL